METTRCKTYHVQVDWSGIGLPREGMETILSTLPSKWWIIAVWDRSSPRGDGNTSARGLERPPMAVWDRSSPRGDGNHRPVSGRIQRRYVWDRSSPRGDGNFKWSGLIKLTEGSLNRLGSVFPERGWKLFTLCMNNSGKSGIGLPREGMETSHFIAFNFNNVWDRSSPRGDGNDIVNSVPVVNCSIVWDRSSPRGDGNHKHIHIITTQHRVWDRSSPRGDGNDRYQSMVLVWR